MNIVYFMGGPDMSRYGHTKFERARKADSETEIKFVSRPQREPQRAVQSSVFAETGAAMIPPATIQT